MKENWVSCSECPTRASGIWLALKDDEPIAFIRLCARCGLHDYIHKREAFSPTLRLSLVRTLSTGFRQCDTHPDNIPVKHWVEVKQSPEHVYPNGRTASDLIKANTATRYSPSSVHPSLLNFHRS